jgi:hypothetical protein
VNHSGNDAWDLYCDGTVLDVFGKIGEDPGSEWGSGLCSTADNTLTRKANVSTGDIVGTDVFDPAIEWDCYATDSFTYIGSHSVVTP